MHREGPRQLVDAALKRLMSSTADRSADVAIVGAGAAGLATAIFAARKLPGRRVLLLDGAARPGAKILIAGGGRCNVTNRRVTPTDFCGGSRHAIRKVLAALPVEQTVAWFAEMGVNLHEEEHGKLFPDTHRARTVLDALLAETRRSGASLLAGYRVTHVEHLDEGGFRMDTSGGPIRAARVVLASGGVSLPKTGSDGVGYEMARRLGHSIVPTTPALVPLVLDGTFHADLSGISHDVELTVAADGTKPVRIRGAMLWTHFGVSGPAVLNTSRHWLRARLNGQSPTVTANLLAGDDLNSAERRLLDLVARQPRTILRNALAAWLPSRVADAVLAALPIDGRVSLAHLGRTAMAHAVRSAVERSLGGRRRRQRARPAAGSARSHRSPRGPEQRRRGGPDPAPARGGRGAGRRPAAASDRPRARTSRRR